jgi:Leucine-rich repeat (LRR) protein
MGIGSAIGDSSYSVMICRLFIVCLFIFFVTPAVCDVLADDPIDRAALLDLHSATTGTLGWYKSTNWTISNISFCYWKGVGCVCSGSPTSRCRVKSISLNSNRLIGTIPTSIGDLSALTLLSLSYNALRSSIPLSICRLVLLQTLILTTNVLDGSIPPCIGSMAKLEILYLAHNRFSGEIPDSMYSLNGVQGITLSDNLLSGTISHRIGLLGHSLLRFDVSNNNLIGALPDALGNLSVLETFYATNNGFNSTIPESFGDMPNLYTFEVANCSLVGSIPASFGRLQGLDTLNLFSNRLTGTIPAALGQSGSLAYLDLRDNFLSGTIPNGLFALTSLYDVDFSKNMLSGNLNASIPTLSSRSGLSALRMSSNLFTGTLPASFQTFRSLQILDVRNCRLNGSIPDWIGSKMPKLTYLDLAQNFFSSVIPATLGQNSPRLNHLDLSSNLLIGSLPLRLVNLTALQYFDVSMNQLSGSVLLDFSHLRTTDFQYFSISFNRFSGSLQTIMKFPFIPGVFNISHNQFNSLFPRLPSKYVPFPDPDPLTGEVVFPSDFGGSLGYTSIRIIDARGTENVFDCPIPDYVESASLFLRTECRPQYEALVTLLFEYTAGIASIILIYAVVRFLFSRCDSSSGIFRRASEIASISQFILMWMVSLFALYCDQGIFRSMMLYLATTIDNCKPINLFYSFIHYMPYFPADAFPIFTEFAYAEWIAGIAETASANSFLFVPPGVVANGKAFQHLCVNVANSGCGIRQALDPLYPDFVKPEFWFAHECYLEHPELAPFGGSGHSTFRMFVIAILSVRCLIEASRAALVVLSFFLKRIPGSQFSVNFVFGC